jgi:hypothetical protein
VQFLSRFDAHHRQPVAQHLANGIGQREARRGQRRIIGKHETAAGIIIAQIPLRVEGAGQITKVKGDAVWFARFSGLFDDTRP